MDDVDGCLARSKFKHVLVLLFAIFFFVVFVGLLVVRFELGSATCSRSIHNAQGSGGC